MGAKDITITMALILIFTVSMITFATTFADRNNAAINIGDDYKLGNFVSDSKSDAETYTVSINGTLETYQQTKVIAGSETTETGSTFKDKGSSPTNAFKNILKVIRVKIFGDGADNSSPFTWIFTTLLSTFLLITVWYSWKLWKSGAPD